MEALFSYVLYGVSDGTDVRDDSVLGNVGIMQDTGTRRKRKVSTNQVTIGELGSYWLNYLTYYRKTEIEYWTPNCPSYQLVRINHRSIDLTLCILYYSENNLTSLQTLFCQYSLCSFPTPSISLCGRFNIPSFIKFNGPFPPVISVIDTPLSLYCTLCPFLI